jgi:hypothetical protein
LLLLVRVCVGCEEDCFHSPPKSPSLYNGPRPKRPMSSTSKQACETLSIIAEEPTRGRQTDTNATSRRPTRGGETSLWGPAFVALPSPANAIVIWLMKGQGAGMVYSSQCAGHTGHTYASQGLNGSPFAQRERQPYNVVAQDSSRHLSPANVHDGWLSLVGVSILSMKHHTVTRQELRIITSYLSPLASRRSRTCRSRRGHRLGPSLSRCNRSHSGQWCIAWC